MLASAAATQTLRCGQNAYHLGADLRLHENGNIVWWEKMVAGGWRSDYVALNTTSIVHSAAITEHRYY